MRNSPRNHLKITPKTSAPRPKTPLKTANSLRTPLLILLATFALSILFPLSAFAKITAAVKNCKLDDATLNKYNQQRIYYYNPGECTDAEDEETPTITCTSATTDPSVSVSGDSIESMIWNGLLSIMDAEHAAGAMGNMYVESKLNPAAHETSKQSLWQNSWFDLTVYRNPNTNDKITYGIGLIQWSGGRRKNFYTWLQSNYPELVHYIDERQTYGLDNGDGAGARFLSKAGAADTRALIAAEVAYLKYEMEHWPNDYGVYLNETGSVENLAKAFKNKIEKGGSDLTTRQNKAREYYNLFNSESSSGDDASTEECFYDDGTPVEDGGSSDNGDSSSGDNDGSSDDGNDGNNGNDGSPSSDNNDNNNGNNNGNGGNTSTGSCDNGCGLQSVSSLVAQQSYSQNWKTSADRDIATSGCSLIAVVNAAKALGKSVDVASLASWTYNTKKISTAGWDTSVKPIAEHLGLKLSSSYLYTSESTSYSTKLAAIKKVIANGGVVIASGGGKNSGRSSLGTCSSSQISSGLCVFSPGGHFITIVGVTSSNKLVIANPAKGSKSGQNWTFPAENVLKYSNKAKAINL